LASRDLRFCAANRLSAGKLCRSAQPTHPSPRDFVGPRCYNLRMQTADTTAGRWNVGRPLMPAGYGLGSGPGPMSPATVVGQLTTARSYWVCTTRADGRPHAMPVWGLWLGSPADVLGGSLAFSTDPTSLKARNLLRDPRIVIHLESGDDVVVLEGRARTLEVDADADLVAEFITEYDRKYSVKVEPGPGFGLYALSPEVVLAWQEVDFPNTPTRWARSAGG
jgi:hypothetical protein